MDQNQSQSIADLKMGMKFVALEDVHTSSPVAIHPQEDLAKFSYRPEMKENKF